MENVCIYSVILLDGAFSYDVEKILNVCANECGFGKIMNHYIAFMTTDFLI